MRWFFVGISIGVLGCHSSSSGDLPGSSAMGTSAASAGTTGAGGAPTSTSVTSGNAAGTGGTIVVGQLDGGVETSLPPLPALTHVVAEMNDDSASITFDPVDGAVDYRVYPLPADGDIQVASDGHVVVKNAIYHCAGNRESALPFLDNTAMTPGDAINTRVDNVMVGGYLRQLTDATLGYVYTDPGPGLVPVYVLGESDTNADNSSCYFARWSESRVKKYTTSETEKSQLLADFARDDGIAFYMPAAAAGTTTQIYFDEDQVGTQYQSRYYFPEGPEAQAHANKTAAFNVLTQAAPGTTPLMRVFYLNVCGWSHDELPVGKERFNRAYKQGDNQPWWSLLWPGITDKTTLVVEALDTQCPYQGHLSPTALPQITAYFGPNMTQPLIHQPFVTIDDVRAASATTEVFVNGQNGPAWTWNGDNADGSLYENAPTAAELSANAGASAPLPKAVARSFIEVEPLPHPKMDFFDTFAPNSTPETFTTVPCGVPGGNCFATWRQQSPTFDQMFINVDSSPVTGNPLIAYGQVMGELWVTYGDVAADTNGKFRLTANQKANMDASTFLHVTMEVDAYSTARRYPQILISDQEAPVQYGLVNGHTLVVETIGEGGDVAYWPLDYQLQICNLRTWDVNDQCPAYDLYHVKDASGMVQHLAPNDEVGEHASVDHRVVFDVFTSTQRTYLFLDHKPYACADLPAVGAPSGPVTVTWGDVLYHSAVDLNFAFHADHMQIDQRRHFDNLGFSSGVPAPEWDEARFPCALPITP